MTDVVTGWTNWVPCESLVVASADNLKYYRSADGRPYYVNSNCTYYASRKNWIGKKSFLMPSMDEMDAMDAADAADAAQRALRAW